MANWGKRADWIGVSIFFAVACLWSALAARYAVLSWPGTAQPSFDASIVAGSGPVLGAIAARLLRPRNAAPVFGLFLGRSRQSAWLALAAPAVTLGLFGLPREGWNAHANGVIFAISVLLYCLGEELGWRGWLRHALAGLPTGWLVAITATLWYLWHWTFLSDQLLKPAFGIGFAVGILLASWGLNAVSRRGGGSALAVAWHAAFKTLGAPAQIAAMTVLLAVATWRSGRIDKPAD